MKNTGRFGAIVGALGMLLLIFDSKTALKGAAEGLELCLWTVIPALFPFFVLSIMVTGSAGHLPTGWLRPLGRLTGIPNGSETILLAGYLGGYPIGAKCLAEARCQGRISQEDAARMMAFCSNAGPAFIFGMVNAMFDQIWVGWALWGIQIFSSLAVGAILPGKTRGQIPKEHTQGITLPDAVNNAARAMCGVCGWVLLFRMILAFLNRWFLWAFPGEIAVAFTGLLELANGCCALKTLGDPGTRFVICAGMLAFGGLCVGMQTASVARGVSLKWYLPGKLLQTAIAVAIAFCMTHVGENLYHLLLPIGAIPVCYFIFSRRNRKIKVEFPCGLVYNKENT